MTTIQGCWFSLIGLLLMLGGCSIDAEQARVCERLIPWFERSLDAVEMLEIDTSPDNGVVLRYRSTETAVEPAEHWLACRFGGGYFSGKRLHLTAVISDREGELSGLQLELMRALWLGLYEPRVRSGAENSAANDDKTGYRQILYFLQQLINAVILSCTYGLLAIAYTLIYAIIGRINLAFGELAMLGAYATVIGITTVALIGITALPLALFVVLLLVTAVGAAFGWLTERTVFRPLRGTVSQAPLIATIGLGIFLQEYVRLAQSSRDQFLQPVLSESHQLAESAGFTVSATTLQVLIPLLTLGLYVGLDRLIKSSAFGRAQRACTTDAPMALLCGIDVNRTLVFTFVLGSVYAAIAGFVLALYYGVVNFHMGFLVGFKALTAAIVGGIGSVRGAMLGGILIGLLETFWSAYFVIAYKDIAIFALLALFLVFRPDGLYGRPPAR